MTALVWDSAGEKIYQTGVDRGVLYLPDGTAVVWNGLTSVEDDTTAALTSYYIDGVKFYDKITPGDFSGKLKAITYPEEFDSVLGIVDNSSGLYYYDQPLQSFGLSYRTLIGNDQNPDLGYKVHVLYNLVANPDNVVFQTLQDKATPIEFSWTISATPPTIKNYRPTSHVSIDSREASADALAAVEAALYGTDTITPSLPSISSLAGMVTG
jgi:hypothetical protein